MFSFYRTLCNNLNYSVHVFSQSGGSSALKKHQQLMEKNMKEEESSKTEVSRSLLNTFMLLVCVKYFYTFYNPEGAVYRSLMRLRL